MGSWRLIALGGILAILLAAIAAGVLLIRQRPVLPARPAPEFTWVGTTETFLNGPPRVVAKVNPNGAMVSAVQLEWGRRPSLDHTAALLITDEIPRIVSRALPTDQPFTVAYVFDDSDFAQRLGLGQVIDYQFRVAHSSLSGNSLHTWSSRDNFTVTRVALRDETARVRRGGISLGVQIPFDSEIEPNSIDATVEIRPNSSPPDPLLHFQGGESLASWRTDNLASLAPLVDYTFKVRGNFGENNTQLGPRVLTQLKTDLDSDGDGVVDAFDPTPAHFFDGQHSRGSPGEVLTGYPRVVVNQNSEPITDQPTDQPLESYYDSYYSIFRNNDDDSPEVARVTDGGDTEVFWAFNELVIAKAFFQAEHLENGFPEEALKLRETSHYEVTVKNLRRVQITNVKLTDPQDQTTEKTVIIYVPDGSVDPPDAHFRIEHTFEDANGQEQSEFLLTSNNLYLVVVTNFDTGEGKYHLIVRGEGPPFSPLLFASEPTRDLVIFHHSTLSTIAYTGERSPQTQAIFSGQGNTYLMFPDIRPLP